MITAILAGGVVIGFNSYIMTPAVLVLIPYKAIPRSPILVPDNLLRHCLVSFCR
jgi:hypothetical protein